MTKNILFLSFMLSQVSCFHSTKSETQHSLDSIPFEYRQTEPGEYLPYIKVSLDGHEKQFILDTGAYESSLATDKWSGQYRAIETSEKVFAQGASGSKFSCDRIRIRSAKLGARDLTPFFLKRCRVNIFGLDFLKEQAFELDFESFKLKTIMGLSKKSSNILRRLPKGHMLTPILLGEIKFDAVFDTGSSATAVDLKFVKKHSHLFEWIGAEDGSDQHSGNKIKSDAYLTPSIIIGNHEFKNVKIVAFDFPENMRLGMKGSPMILGTNIIGKAKWQFDFKNKRWAMSVF